MARARRFALVQLAREDDAHQDCFLAVIAGFCDFDLVGHLVLICPVDRKALPDSAKFLKAERALNAVATLSLQKVNMQSDDSMSRALSSKSILRLERFLSTSGIESQAHFVIQRQVKKTACESESVIRFKALATHEQSTRATKEKDIAGECAIGREHHECLSTFADNPAIVKWPG